MGSRLFFLLGQSCSFSRALSTAAAPSPFHPRNRHTGRYDFAALAAASPPLAAVLAPDARTGELSLDWSSRRAVLALNAAIALRDYGITGLNELPESFLVPPIPGRADYLHVLADLLGEDNGCVPPRGPLVRGLDIGTGASAIYPLLGCAEYGWSFAATEVDPAALASARRLAEENRDLGGGIVVLPQQSAGLAAPQTGGGPLRRTSRHRIFDGTDDVGACFSMCNPPWYASEAAQRAQTARKWRGLSASRRRRSGEDNRPPTKAERAAERVRPGSCGGTSSELWCEGGEAGFVGDMLEQSAEQHARWRSGGEDNAPPPALWHSTLVSSQERLPQLQAKARAVLRASASAGGGESRVIELGTGNKKLRVLAWSFLSPAQRAQHLARILADE